VAKLTCKSQHCFFFEKKGLAIGAQYFAWLKKNFTWLLWWSQLCSWQAKFGRASSCLPAWSLFGYRGQNLAGPQFGMFSLPKPAVAAGPAWT
jgi:hypothetical protein